jgi:hypothetical protein
LAFIAGFEGRDKMVDLESEFDFEKELKKLGHFFEEFIEYFHNDILFGKLLKACQNDT